jgi:hypothetical protein
MAKWAARFALGLSNSSPGLRLDRSDIFCESDIGLLRFANADSFFSNPIFQ